MLHSFPSACRARYSSRLTEYTVRNQIFFEFTRMIACDVCAWHCILWGAIQCLIHSPNIGLAGSLIGMNSQLLWTYKSFQCEYHGAATLWDVNMANFPPVAPGSLFTPPTGWVYKERPPLLSTLRKPSFIFPPTMVPYQYYQVYLLTPYLSATPQSLYIFIYTTVDISIMRTWDHRGYVRTRHARLIHPLPSSASIVRRVSIYKYCLRGGRRAEDVRRLPI